MSDKFYIRPISLVWGKAAIDAVAQGVARPVAGGPAACTAFELIERRSGAAKRQILLLRDLTTSTDTLVQTFLHRIASPRAPVTGLTFERPLIMGIVNVTPDSFSDGGDFEAAQDAIAQVRHIAKEGADILDIGGESTRPGSDAVEAAEELRRVLPVIRGCNNLTQPVSIDSRKAGVMAAAIEAGAAMINDVSALTHDPFALETAARLKVPVVLMHAKGDPRTMQDNPIYEDVLLEVYDFLEARIEAAEEAGISRSLLIADPGIGFGKSFEHNLTLLSGIGLLHGLGVPILLGASRKRFVGNLTGESEAKRRASGSVGIALAAAAQAVQIFRVHDVHETRHALDCWFAAAQGGM